jgi:hypothetical protein
MGRSRGVMDSDSSDSRQVWTRIDKDTEGKTAVEDDILQRKQRKARFFMHARN